MILARFGAGLNKLLLLLTMDCTRVEIVPTLMVSVTGSQFGFVARP
jgi:hypothetical protein